MDTICIEDANVEDDDNSSRTLRQDYVRGRKAFLMKSINY